MAVLLMAIAALGAALVLSELRWFRPVRLTTRLAPYSPSGANVTRRPLSFNSFREVLAPLANSVGSTVSAVLGIHEDLSLRLSRIHSPLEPATFRLRQLAYAIVALGVSGLLILVLTPPAPLAFIMVFGSPVLAFLIPEQQLSSAGARWQNQIFLELPVVAEQLGMLLSAGFSLGSALRRLAERGQGCSGQDLRRVTALIRYGQSDVEALRNWSQTAQVPALERLVGVLSLNREAGDLGKMISEEARSIRRDSQRQTIEAIERKAQMVWIPVTVAALVPGTLFLVVPFIEAMRFFTSP